MSRLLLIASLVLLPAGIGRAQAQPQTREGFWISFGLGVGSLSCEDCENRENGTSVTIRMGGTLSQRLLIGGEANMWTKTVNDVTLTVGNIGPVLVFYPSPDGGFFLKGGLGMARIDLDLGSVAGEETGVGITLGLGYDARVGRRFALTPYFDLLSGSFDGGSLNTVAFGLGFTWP